jgi:glycosyltransferase involved in cell wall biosynthesis
MEKELTKFDVLLVTNVWTGAAPFFYEGQENSKGMPAFNNVFYRLLKDQRVDKVYILIWKPERKIHIPATYANKVKIYTVDQPTNSLLSKLSLMRKSVTLGVKIVRSNPTIKQLIGFGSLGGVTALVSRKTGVPDFRRLYGTFLINELSQPKWKLFLKHPLEYLTFNRKGKGLIITNDGTKGDVVFRKIGNKKLPLYFLLNGVDKDIANNARRPEHISLSSEFMVYVARLDPWKRQHLLIEALHKMQSKGIEFPNTYIIGADSFKDYTRDLVKLVEKYNLTQKVHFIYGLPIQEVHYMLKNSVMTFSLYHTSNLGNVFIEALQLGVPMIAINDTGSLDLIDSNAYYELKTDNIEEIEGAITKLIGNKPLRDELAINARNFATKQFLSWSERAEYEINLMLGI